MYQQNNNFWLEMRNTKMEMRKSFKALNDEMMKRSTAKATDLESLHRLLEEMNKTLIVQDQNNGMLLNEIAKHDKKYEQKMETLDSYLVFLYILQSMAF